MRIKDKRQKVIMFQENIGKFRRCVSRRRLEKRKESQSETWRIVCSCTILLGSQIMCVFFWLISLIIKLSSILSLSSLVPKKLGMCLTISQVSL